MDLDTSRYETFADLFEYCRRVASAVGLICIKIFGCRSEQARDYAINLGLALQLTNILRDVSDDLDAGPALPAARGSAGVRVHGRGADGRRDDRSGPAPDGVRVPARPRVLPPGRGGDSAEDRRRLVAAEIMRAVYFETLNRIELSGYDVFTARVRVPRVTQAIIALKQFLWRR